MKRAALERHLRKHGAHRIRPGGKHDVWGLGKRRAAIPRRRELKRGTARAICKDLGVPFPG